MWKKKKKKKKYKNATISKRASRKTGERVISSGPAMVEKSILIVSGGGGGVALFLMLLLLLLLLIVILLACRPWRFCSGSSPSPSRFRPSIKVYLSPHSPHTYTYTCSFPVILGFWFCTYLLLINYYTHFLMF